MANRASGERLSVLAYIDSTFPKKALYAHLSVLKQAMNDLSDEVIRLTADLILDDYPDLYLSDLILFSKMMAKGKYGKPYGKPTTQYIFDCFEKYYQDRQEVRISYREREHERRKAEALDWTLSTEEVKEFYRKAKQIKPQPEKRGGQVLNINNLGL